MSNYDKDKITQLITAWYRSCAILEEFEYYVKEVMYDGFEINCSFERFKYEIEEEPVRGFMLRDFKITSYKYYKSDIKFDELKKKYFNKDLKIFIPKSYSLPNKEKFLSLENLVKVDINLFQIKNDIKLPTQNIEDQRNILDFYKNHSVSLAISSDPQKKLENDVLYQNVAKSNFNRVTDLISYKNKIFKKLFDEKRILIENIKNNNPTDNKYIISLVKLANLLNYIPDFLRKSYNVFYNKETKMLLLELEFPDYQEVDLKLKRNTTKEKEKIVKNTLYSLIVRNASMTVNLFEEKIINSVTINVWQNWFDPATGTKRTGNIASLHSNYADLKILNLEKLNPELCVKSLKGIVTSSLEKIMPIRPIFEFNKEDKRFVKSKKVDNDYDQEFNLAIMPWEDFEHLVAQLFEWEFASKGMEVHVTRTSRDRGVDAIIFDPDPFRGGKYVIQAKRYTNIVDVSAVRDLYGTIMNEGANRGILITTSYYGSDSYDFSKDKPISLIDGPNLLDMLSKHGKRYKIDLDEAKEILKNQNN